MRMETEYLVSAKSEQAIDRIIAIWGDIDGKGDGCSFEDYDNDVFGVMEKVIKLVHEMESTGKKDEFSIVGKCESDYDCVLFAIEFTGSEPFIKASQADPEEDEESYCQFCDAEYDEIAELLQQNKKRTFEQAIEDDLPLGGFLDVSYDEWVASILNE